MDGKTFIGWAIQLLQEIEASAEKREWCERYSVYASDRQETQMECDLETFFDHAYQLDLIISNYHSVIEMWELEERSIMCADTVWLEERPYLCILACIAYHFRRDHFCEGSLINKSIASGAMLRLLQRLNALYDGANLPTTLETLYRSDCKNIPEEPGIYHILAPSGMTIQFENTSTNHTAPLYDAKRLTEKYLSCNDRDILYIGKAGDRAGLRKRLLRYMKYGWNKTVSHKRGRAIWQIKDAGVLLLEYECCEEYEKREHEMLKAFQEKNGRYPVANWRG